MSMVKRKPVVAPPGRWPVEPRLAGLGPAIFRVVMFYCLRVIRPVVVSASTETMRLLVCNDQVMDVIGQFGNDPGAEWVANGIST